MPGLSNVGRVAEQMGAIRISGSRSVDDVIGPLSIGWNGSQSWVLAWCIKEMMEDVRMTQKLLMMMRSRKFRFHYRYGCRCLDGVGGGNWIEAGRQLPVAWGSRWELASQQRVCSYLSDGVFLLRKDMEAQRNWRTRWRASR